MNLDETQHGRDSPQEAEPRALRFACGVRLVAKVGVVGIGGDLVVNNGEAGGPEGLLAYLLGELIKAIAHGDTVLRMHGISQILREDFLRALGIEEDGPVLTITTPEELETFVASECAPSS